MKYEMFVYCYKKLFFYIGWIVVKCEDGPTLYYDNNPVTTIESDPGVVYLTFGLTQKSVFNKMSSALNKKLLKKYPID